MKKMLLIMLLMPLMMSLYSCTCPTNTKTKVVLPEKWKVIKYPKSKLVCLGTEFKTQVISRTIGCEARVVHLRKKLENINK